ncbi:hydroxypyruvate isomerase [Lewinellaceae bacterium SD302]|nr:hydroxypyruvate isomerase [Lewinellaceae bacterium SD302]
MNRRKAIKNAALGLGAISMSRSLAATQNADQLSGLGQTNHSACVWCYNGIPLEELADRGKDLGLKSIELTTVDQWPILQKRGLTCAMGTLKEFSIEDGWNDPTNHEKLQTAYRRAIRDAADHGIPNMIVMSGNRRRLTDLEGMINCANGLRPMVKLAEEMGVTLQMELLNSKVDHADYMCDRTEWGVALAEMIGSDRFKLLYDIYHMQIMEGDVIATIRKYADYIGHYHTGGVPGRNEINDSQELNYPAIIRAIHETGFEGYVAQEFIPTYEDKLKALEEGLNICSV